MKILDNIIQEIQNENRKNALELAMKYLDSDQASITKLYEHALKVALYQVDCQENDNECIWREHVKTSIVRSIIESSLPYIYKITNSIPSKQKTVLVVCPEMELHEIGAKMAYHYFLLAGFDAIFVGANTPKDVILDAVRFTKPDYVAVSVTNFYNIVNAKKITQTIKEQYPNILILAGGQAFSSQDALHSVYADKHITSFLSIEEL